MNQIEEMVNKLCPNGVPSESLMNLCKIETGKLNANASAENGQYAFFTTAREISRIDNYRWDEEALLIAGNANVGDVKHYLGKFDAYQRTYVLTKFSKSINPRFLMYKLKNDLQRYLLDKTNSAAMTYIVLSTLQNFPVPVPPIEVQREVVKILDSFTQLEAELKAELEARKTQYEYYRESLFSRNISKHKSLDSVASIWRGRRFIKDDIRSEGVPAIHYGEIYTKYGLAATETYSFLDPEIAAKLRFVSSGDVVLVSAGETIEDIGKSFTWLGEEDAVIHDACYGIRSSAIDPRYMVHFFNTHYFRSQIRKYISSSKISAISIEKLGKVFIPVPSTEEQKAIADALDSIDFLISDSNVGLPAEIAARRQQYEYYRNRLLTFEKLEVA